MRRFRRTIELALVAVLTNVMSCSTDGTPTQLQDVDTVVVTIGLRNLTIGQTVQANAIAQNVSGGPVSGVTLNWASSNPK